MPAAARVGDPTGHPGVIGPPGSADRPDRRHAGGHRRDAAHLLVPAASVPHPPTAIVPPGCPTVLIGGMPAARMGDLSALRRADRHGRAHRDDRRMT